MVMKMISEKDMEIIGYLRANARNKVTEISRHVKMPVTTIYDKIRAHEKKGIFKRHVSLLDFNKLGYSANVLLALKCSRDSRKRLETFLMEHPNVNTLYGSDNGHDFLADVVFENHSRLQEFIDQVHSIFNFNDIQTFHLSQELKKEAFLGNIPVIKR
jgi:DNA-binding Lrp family transcriptional regulator